MTTESTPGALGSNDQLGPLPERWVCVSDNDGMLVSVWRAFQMRDYARAEVALAVAAEREQSAAKITMLSTALRQVAQAHAWLAFGDCRSFGADVTLLSASDADAVARVALGEYSDGPQNAVRAALG